MTVQQAWLRSERVRLLILIGLLSILLLVLMVIRGFPGLIQEHMRAQAITSFVPLVIVFSSFLAYEVVVLMLIGRLLSSHRFVGVVFLYGNALVELSLVTAIILASARGLGLVALVGAPPFVYFLFLTLSALTLNARLCLFAGLVASTEFLLTSLFLLSWIERPPGGATPLLEMLHSPHSYVFKCTLILAGGVIAAFVAQQLKRQLERALHAVEERDRAVSVFGQHVSPQVAELLLKQPIDFTGQERNVCVLFLDIRDFSRIASDRLPGEVMDYLNVLFGSIIPLISEHGGIVNKFLGDGFMAICGAPIDDASQCRHAVQAAQAILARVEELNRAERIPPTQLGIGLHLGVAITGNVGGGDRKEYTVIGDVVNLASRIEQATKQFHCQLIVSEAVSHALTTFAGEDLGMVELKGQPRPVRLFKLA